MKPMEREQGARGFVPSQGTSNEVDGCNPAAPFPFPFASQRRLRRQAQAARQAERGAARTRQKRELRRQLNEADHG